MTISQNILSKFNLAPIYFGTDATVKLILHLICVMLKFEN